MSDGYFGEFWTNPLSVQQHLKAMFDVLDHYIAVDFQYTGYYDNPDVAAGIGSNINVSMDGAYKFFSAVSGAWARAGFPETVLPSFAAPGPGDVYLNINSEANFLQSYEPGTQGWFVFLHEIGHALGLKHTHDGGGTGRPTLKQLGLSEFDKDWFSVMSYQDDFNFNRINFDPATPMVLDVIGLQYLYGKNLSSNAGDSQYDLQGYNLYTSVWDAAGTDVVTAEKAPEGWRINLPDTILSEVNGEYFGNAFPLADTSGSSPHTFLWLQGNIENARGSVYADQINGNPLNNALDGGGGDDRLRGAAGNDALDGSSGTDTAVFDAVPADVSFRRGGGAKVLAEHEQGTDTLEDIEFASFADGTTASLTSLLPALNTAPEAVADTATAVQGESITLAVLGNDTDPDGDDLTLQRVDAPRSGAAMLSGNRVAYTAGANFTGTDSFRYRVGDGHGESDSGSVHVTVTPPSRAGDPIDILDLAPEAQIAAIYVAYFGRAPGAIGMDFWLGQRQESLEEKDEKAVLKDIAESFRQVVSLPSDDPENGEGMTFDLFRAPNEAGRATVADFVSDVFDNLFSRQATSAGLDFWTNTILARLQGGEPVGDVLIDIASGAQQTDATVLRNKMAAARAFSEAFDGAEDLAFDLSRHRDDAVAIVGDVDDRPASVARAADAARALVNEEISVALTATGPNEPATEAWV